MSKVKEVASEVYKNKVLEIFPRGNKIIITFVNIEVEAVIVNIHELAIKIVDKITALGYVASLTKIKQHWWCEFAEERNYVNCGIMGKGNLNSDFDIDTKSDTPLDASVKALEWILKERG